MQFNELKCDVHFAGLSLNKVAKFKQLTDCIFTITPEYRMFQLIC